MKRIKYIISIIIIIIGLIIIGESYLFHLRDFYTQFSNTTLFLQPNTTEEEMINDILNSAEKNEVQVFCYNMSSRSTLHTVIEIYGTENVEKYMNQNLDIYEKEYDSIFLETIQFKFNDIENISDIKNINDYYIIGSNEQVFNFKMDLIDKYAGNYPREGSNNNEYIYNIIGIWSLIILVIILLSFYDVMFQKKENLIRITMGEKISSIVWKNILIDTLVFTAIFVMALLILSKYTYVFFGINISIICFLILIVLNGLLYLNLYKYNLKEVFSNVQISAKLLSVNYILKIVTVVLTLFIISGNIALIFESYDLYKQRSFFENYADYEYLILDYGITFNSDGSMEDNGHKTEIMYNDFYNKFFKKFDITIMAAPHMDSNGLNPLMANKNAYNYLSNEINELEDVDLSKNFYYLIPQNMKDNSTEIVNQLNDSVVLFEGNDFEYDYEILYYQDNVKIVNIDESLLYGSELVKNPVIIYDNISAETLIGEKDEKNYLRDTMYNINEEEFNEFITEYNLKDKIIIRTNVLESYEHHWQTAKNVLCINLIFSALVILLEIIIINSIIRLEYEVNAIELSIKKIMGYSIYEKNKKIILITVISTLISILISIILGSILKIEEIKNLATGGILILIIEICVTGFNINKVEKAKLQQILKGGNL